MEHTAAMIFKQKINEGADALDWDTEDLRMNRSVRRVDAIVSELGEATIRKRSMESFGLNKRRELTSMCGCILTSQQIARPGHENRKAIHFQKVRFCRRSIVDGFRELPNFSKNFLGNFVLLLLLLDETKIAGVSEAKPTGDGRVSFD